MSTPPTPAARAPKRSSSSADSHGLSSVRRVGPTEQVRDQLLTAIQRGDFPPGSMLPSERVLCETFGVSRVSVREAISGLEAVGLVKVRHGRGAFVRAGLADPEGPFVKYLELHREELLELLKVRGALDELAAEEAALHGTPEGLAEMIERRDAFATAVENNDLSQMAASDVAFHVSIARCSTGQLLPELLVELNAVLEESRRMTLAGPGRSAQSVKEHEAIVEAIMAGDARGARRAVARHINSVRGWVLKFNAPATEPVRSAQS
jgi:GntR family transcriptional regulator, transcriptional repressor for pyruvate dehydrogenase complex